MSPRCLICDSSAVVSAQAVSAVVLLISVLHGFMKAARHLPAKDTAVQKGTSPSLEQVLGLVTDGVRESKQKWAESQSFLQDVQRFQFMQFECLCLRCGAMFDEAAGA